MTEPSAGTPLRIGLSCPYAWDAPGGVQVQVRELGTRLRERGHEVLVLTPSREPPLEPWVRGVGRPIAVPYNSSVAPICPWPASRARVHRALERFAPDVVHAHEPLTPSTSLFASGWGGAPVVATFHSGADRSRLFDLAAPALRRAARRISIRVAVSSRAASFAGSRIGGEFVIVPNGVDLERFSGARPATLPPGRRILFVGRLDERKGFPVAVRAFESLAARYADLQLVVVGDGPQAEAVSMLSAEVRRRVVMLGAMANVDLPPYQAASDVYIAPSVGGESFGVVLVEAMAAGVPVVASDIPGYDEVVEDGVEGLLVPPREPSALAAAAARILEDRELADRLVVAGRARAARYSWRVVTSQLEALYRQAVDAAAPASSGQRM